MFGRVLTTLALPLTLATLPLAAQGAQTATSVPSIAPRPAATATVRIQTLAWTEVSVPARLIAAAAGAAAPAGTTRFVLNWQPLAAQPALELSAAQSQCTVTTLITVPCQ